MKYHKIKNEEFSEVCNAILAEYKNHWEHRKDVEKDIKKIYKSAADKFEKKGYKLDLLEAKVLSKVAKEVYKSAHAVLKYYAQPEMNKNKKIDKKIDKKKKGNKKDKEIILQMIEDELGNSNQLIEKAEIKPTKSKSKVTSAIVQVGSTAVQPSPKKSIYGTSFSSDSLTKILGIGPKTATILKENGISTFEKLSTTSIEDIKKMLSKEGIKIGVQNLTTWPMQSTFAAEGRWEELKAWQKTQKPGNQSTGI